MIKPVRRTQAERSEETRKRVAKAAFEVIAERGHSAFRTAAVIAQAGVSQGAMLHHYPTKESLTLAAIHYALNLDRDKSMKRANSTGVDAHATLLAMAADFQDFFIGNQFWVSLDITMDAAKDASLAPEIRAIVADARRPIYSLWEQALVRCGWPLDRSHFAVTTTAAIVSGFAIRTLWNDDANELEPALKQWFDHLESTTEATKEQI
jgi:AcrR family transcriptional regulator